MQTVDSDQTSGSNAAENKGMKLVYGGELVWGMEIWRTLRTIRRATSEDSDHLPMQGRSDFAICGEKKTCNLQFLERLQISG